MLAAPAPLRQADFARTLGRVLGRPARMPMPAGALRLVAGGFAEALLASQRVVPERATATGYRFRFPTLEGALRDLLV